MTILGLEGIRKTVNKAIRRIMTPTLNLLVRELIFFDVFIKAGFYIIAHNVLGLAKVGK